MDCYFSKLMSEHSCTNFVIVRDDAMIADHQRLLSAPSSPKEEAPQREAFEHLPQEKNNAAPTLPCRKKSHDDLHLISRKSGNRHKRISLNDALLSHGIKNIANHLPSVAEGSASQSASRHVLFDDIFRDMDDLLKQTAYD